MTFGEEIRKLRNSQFRNLKSVADPMGWSVSYQSGLELNHQAVPSLEVAIKLIDELGGDRPSMLHLLNKGKHLVEIIQPKSETSAEILSMLQSKISEDTSPRDMFYILNEAVILTVNKINANHG